MIDSTAAQAELFSSDTSAKNGDMVSDQDLDQDQDQARQRPGSLFGAKIRDLRTRNGMAQRTLAKSLGVSPAYLSQLESGKKGRPSDRLIHAICHQFGLIWDEADDLFVLADSSKRIVKIDTSGLDARKTQLARHFANKLPDMTSAQVKALYQYLDSDVIAQL